jgi:hypothetical protein
MTTLLQKAIEQLCELPAEEHDLAAEITEYESPRAVFAAMTGQNPYVMRQFGNLDMIYFPHGGKVRRGT